MWRPAAISFCIAMTAGAGLAQQIVHPGPPPSDTINPKAAARERQEREARLRSSGWVTREATDYRGTRAAVEAMKEDYVRLQVLRNEIARHVTADRPLDYKFLAKRAEEVHKRAGRMRAVMMPQVAEKAEKVEARQVELDAVQVRSALVTLCRLIDSFTENPMFELPGTVDVELSAKAGSDIQSIVLLSESMRREAERLSKARPR